MSMLVGFEAENPPKKKSPVPRFYPRWEEPNPIDASVDSSLRIISIVRSAAQETKLKYAHVKFKDESIPLGKWYRRYIRKIGNASNKGDEE